MIVFLGAVELSLKEMLDLDVGDTIRLNKIANDEVSVYVHKKKRYLASVGFQGYRKTIQIKEVIYSEKERTKEILEMLERAAQRQSGRYYENRKKSEKCKILLRFLFKRLSLL